MEPFINGSNSSGFEIISDRDEPFSALGTHTTSLSGETSSNVTIGRPGISAEVLISVPRELYRSTLDLTDQFSERLEHAEDCQAHIFALFLDFLSEKIQECGLRNGDTIRILSIVQSHMEAEVIGDGEIHAVVAQAMMTPTARYNTIRAYLRAQQLLGLGNSSGQSKFFDAAENGMFQVYAIFGGQGTGRAYFDDLLHTYSTYQPILHDFVTTLASSLRALSTKECFSFHYENQELDILNWLHDPNCRPPTDEYLVSAPVSFPLIGLLQLMKYRVHCTLLGFEPRDMSSRLKGVTGHSQGILIAAVVAAATTWESFEDLSIQALTILLSIGCRSQEEADCRFAYSSSRMADSVADGVPSPMLSVRGLSQKKLKSLMGKFNNQVTEKEQIELSLLNGARVSVVTGPPRSLDGFATILSISGSSKDQSRIPHIQRQPQISCRFLQVTAPFHSSYLGGVCQAVMEDCGVVEMFPGDLRIPIFSTRDGNDLKAGDPKANIIPDLISMITRGVLRWKSAVAFPGATHVIDFGPGGPGGAGALAKAIKEGLGVRCILAGSLPPSESVTPDFGYMQELLDTAQDYEPPQERAWKDLYSPRLGKTLSGELMVITKLTALLGLPPVMVAGMTPTTACVHLVKSIINAGYHVELATGGYHNADALAAAIRSIAKDAGENRGITCNVVYADPKSVQWIIPTLQRLRNTEQLPLDGLTIGAGVPSVEVLHEYVQTMRLKHIGLKPGSVDAIRRVLCAADELQDTAVILQWTGGRGGGHHSYEDFHQPILDTYAEIRRRKNVILVAGSGFSGASDTLPYLTGDWARERGMPCMPFDGVLLGSRIMVAKEARTSDTVKQLIAATPGVEDGEWHNTFAGPAGGVLTVKSEMGEPIHKIATRGVRLWAEFDRDIFSLAKREQGRAVQKRSSYIISRLNADYHRVWFGIDDTTGEPAELWQMTYLSTLRRLVNLTYVRAQDRWAHSSWKDLCYKWAVRIQARLTDHVIPILTNADDFDQPDPAMAKILAAIPMAATTYLSYDDCQFFVQLCKKRGQKPVPFIPVLNEDFETWFKKDSLWQSEDIDAVPGADPERVCVLQGPVAVRGIDSVNEPVQSILDAIHQGHISHILDQDFDGEKNSVGQTFPPKPSRLPRRRPLRDSSHDPNEEKSSVCTNTDLNHEVCIDSTEKTDDTAWLASLSSHVDDAGARAIILDTDLGTASTNPVRQMLIRLRGICNHVVHTSSDSSSAISLYHTGDVGSCKRKVVQIEWSSTDTSPITVEIYYHANRSLASPITLQLLYARSSFPVPHPRLREDVSGRIARIKDFYHRAWFGEPLNRARSMRDVFEGPPVTLTAEMVRNFGRSIGARSGYASKAAGANNVPMDLAILVAWRSLIEPLFCQEIEADFLRLVHLSNEILQSSHDQPRCLALDQTFSSSSKIRSIINQDHGKVVEVWARIEQDGVTVFEVISRFLFRGQYDDLKNTFKTETLPPTSVRLSSRGDVAVLRSKPWFHLDDPEADLPGNTLLFTAKSSRKHSSCGPIVHVEVVGEIKLQVSPTTTTHLGSCRYNGQHTVLDSLDPITSYLTRHGQPLSAPRHFENSIPMFEGKQFVVRAPRDNEEYASISADWNPIHTCPAFASLAGHSGPIVHGMNTSARIRVFAEEKLCNGNAGLFRRFDCKFTDIVLPDTELRLTFNHVGMLQGHKIIQIEAVNTATGRPAVKAECEIEPGVTTYVFTGQGGQHKGMGMELRDYSEPARKVWDLADSYFLREYGTSRSDILSSLSKNVPSFHHRVHISCAFLTSYRFQDHRYRQR